MNTRDRQLEKLMWWNKFWLCLLLFTLLIGGGLFWVTSIISDVESLEIKTTPNAGLRFSSMSDGPFVITHLFSYAGPNGRASAAFPKALLFYDSGGVEISRAEIDALRWLDSQNQVVKAPQDSSQIRAVFYRAQVLRKKSDQ